MLLHASEKGDGPAHVDAVVLQRDLARFAHSLRVQQSAGYALDQCILAYLESCKVDDAVNVRVCCKDLAQCLLVGDVDLVEDWPFAADQLNAVQGYLRRVVQAVDNDNLVAMLKKG
jgi:hypothetical protein